MENQTQRETKEVEVGNHVLIVNTYITGREARNIEGIMIDQIEINQTGKEQQFSGVKASKIKDRQDEQVNSVVVSINGSAENILDTILDLPSTESEAIMKIVSDIAEPKKEQASN